ncbi:MAG: hypothetical protein CM15mP120_15980 [Pseudomonadota bacterium]|nr:MAG: hypothetical protein CM15mP120_15980 [Pseudomonadota bacterium]
MEAQAVVQDLGYSPVKPVRWVSKVSMPRCKMVSADSASVAVAVEAARFAASMGVSTLANAAMAAPG